MAYRSRRSRRRVGRRRGSRSRRRRSLGPMKIGYRM